MRATTTRGCRRRPRPADGPAVRPASNRFRVTQSMGDVVSYSGALRRIAVELGKIASDLRLLSMGPRAGLGEIRLPAVQPGSSIMPGKVNPSVPEMVNQVCYQVYGCDVTIAMAGEAGQLELNVMMPVMAWNGLHAQHILTTAMKTLRERTVVGIEADLERSRELLDRSTAMATALSPYIGYAATADIAKAAVATGRPIRDLVRERGLMSEEELNSILSAEAMTQPGVKGATAKQPRSEVVTSRLFLALVLAADRQPRRHLPRASLEASHTVACFLLRISGCSRLPIATSGSTRIR